MQQDGTRQEGAQIVPLKGAMYLLDSSTLTRIGGGWDPREDRRRDRDSHIVRFATRLTVSLGRQRFSGFLL